MGLFSGLKRGGDKKKKEKYYDAAPAAVMEKDILNQAFLGDDPYLRAGGPAKLFMGPGSGIRPTDYMMRTNSERSDSDSLFGPPSHGSAQPSGHSHGSFPHPPGHHAGMTPPQFSPSQFSQFSQFSQSNASALDLPSRPWSDRAGEDRPSSSRGPGSKPWGGPAPFAARFGAASPNSRSADGPAAELDSDAAVASKNPSTSSASPTVRSDASQKTAATVATAATAATAATVATEAAELGDHTTDFQSAQSTPLAGKEAASGEAASGVWPLSAEEPPNVPFPNVPLATATPQTDADGDRESKARDVAKKNNLAIQVPRRRSWSKAINQLERQWLEQQLPSAPVPTMAEGHAADAQAAKAMNEAEQEAKQAREAEERRAEDARELAHSAALAAAVVDATPEAVQPESGLEAVPLPQHPYANQQQYGPRPSPGASPNARGFAMGPGPNTPNMQRRPGPGPGPGPGPNNFDPRFDPRHARQPRPNQPMPPGMPGMPPGMSPGMPQQQRGRVADYDFMPSVLDQYGGIAGGPYATGRTARLPQMGMQPPGTRSRSASRTRSMQSVQMPMPMQMPMQMQMQRGHRPLHSEIDYSAPIDLGGRMPETKLPAVLRNPRSAQAQQRPDVEGAMHRRLPSMPSEIDYSAPIDLGGRMPETRLPAALRGVSMPAPAKVSRRKRLFHRASISSDGGDGGDGGDYGGHAHLPSEIDLGVPIDLGGRMPETRLPAALRGSKSMQQLPRMHPPSTSNMHPMPPPHSRAGSMASQASHASQYPGGAYRNHPPMPGMRSPQYRGPLNGPMNGPNGPNGPMNGPNGLMNGPRRLPNGSSADLTVYRDQHQPNQPSPGMQGPPRSPSGMHAQQPSAHGSGSGAPSNVSVSPGRDAASRPGSASGSGSTGDARFLSLPTSPGAFGQQDRQLSDVAEDVEERSVVEMDASSRDVRGFRGAPSAPPTQALPLTPVTPTNKAKTIQAPYAQAATPPATPVPTAQGQGPGQGPGPSPGRVVEHVLTRPVATRSASGGTDYADDAPLSPVSLPAGDAAPSPKSNWPLPSVHVSSAEGQPGQGTRMETETGGQTDSALSGRQALTASVYAQDIGLGPYAAAVGAFGASETAVDSNSDIGMARGPSILAPASPTSSQGLPPHAAVPLDRHRADVVDKFGTTFI